MYYHYPNFQIKSCGTTTMGLRPMKTVLGYNLGQEILNNGGVELMKNIKESLKK